MPAPQVIITPEAGTVQLAEAILEIQRILTQGLGIGDPGAGSELVRRTTPTPLRPLTLLGRPDNLYGSLVEVTLSASTDLGTNITVTHSLGQPAPSTRGGRNQRLNVRWIPAGIRYLTDNYGVDLPVAADHRILVLYADGAVGEDSIELRFYTDLTLGGANNAALKVTLFVIPSSA